MTEKKPRFRLVSMPRAEFDELKKKYTIDGELIRGYPFFECEGELLPIPHFPYGIERIEDGIYFFET